MNLLKTVHMPCFCTHNPPHIILRSGQQVPQVHSYKYLGTIITADGSPCEARNFRLGESSAMFNNFRPVWNNRYLALKCKVKIFKYIFESKPIHALQHSSSPLHRKGSSMHGTSDTSGGWHQSHTRTGHTPPTVLYMPEPMLSRLRLLSIKNKPHT